MPAPPNFDHYSKVSFFFPTQNILGCDVCMYILWLIIVMIGEIGYDDSRKGGKGGREGERKRQHG